VSSFYFGKDGLKVILLKLLVLILIVPILLVWIANYYDGRWEHCCHTYISYKNFVKFYGRFPEKWVLVDNFVVFKSKADYLRLYFKNPIDLLKYHLFKVELERKRQKEYEQTNHRELVKAFEVLNEREEKRA
jgi:hypothetical protein